MIFEEQNETLLNAENIEGNFKIYNLFIMLVLTILFNYSNLQYMRIEESKKVSRDLNQTILIVCIING
jgi:hypothetical protein